MRIIGSGMASSALDTVRPESRWAQASVLVSWVALLCALVVGKTHASDASAPQDQSASAAALEEITVTARRVSENLQQTPVSITAITSEDIDNRGITSIADLASEAPNVTLEQNTAGFGKSAIAFIRGVGQYDYLPAFEPGVGFYVDDVYQGTLFGSLVNLTDIGRVEVLRGPQGTLFGKDNEGGAVRFFSPQPTGDNSGSVEAGYGSYNRQQLKGSFDVALVPDQLFLRVSAGSNSYNGYVRLVDFVCAYPALSGTLPRTTPNKQSGNCDEGTLGGDDSKAARATLRWLPTKDLDIQLSADVLDDKGEPGAETLLAANPAIAAGGPIYGGVPWDSRFISKDPFVTYSTYTDPKTGLSFPKVNNISAFDVTNSINWDTSFGIHVKNILAYRRYNGEFTEIWGNAPVHTDDNYFKPYHHQLSEELQFSGKLFDDKLDWTVGGYYYKALTELNDYISIPLVNFAFFGVDPVDDKDSSGFLHGVYHVTDKLSVEGGVRHTSQSKTYTFDRLIPTPTGQPQIYLPGFDPSLAKESSTSRFDYRASVSYQWTPDIMTYAQYATGFKGPGINPRPSSAADVIPFKEEDLKSYEIGAKTQWLDNRLRLNVSGYVSDYTNLQLSIAIDEGGVPGSTVANAGKVRITGGEAELEAEPISRLLISASVGVLKYDILELGSASGFPGGPALGDQAPYVPNQKVGFAIQYGIGLAGFGTLTPRIDTTYQSKTYADPSNSPLAETGGYSLTDFHLTYDSPSDKWQGQFEIKNLFNRLYYVNKFFQYDSAGMVVGQPGMPLTLFVSVKRKF
jgi:iron complex outermembrane receptor protein